MRLALKEMAIGAACAVALVAACSTIARAGDRYTSDDTLVAIQMASRDTGVSVTTLTNIIGCETGWTFNPYALGDHGHSHGAAQINDYGNAAPAFYAIYSDPYNPYEATYFMAEVLRGDHPPLGRHTWNC